MGQIEKIYHENSQKFQARRAIQNEERLDTLKAIEAEDAKGMNTTHALETWKAGEQGSVQDGDNSAAGGDGVGGTGEVHKGKKQGREWKQIYGIELTRTVYTLSVASASAMLADSDPDNLVYQRRSEESACAAIEALEARNCAEKATADKAATSPLHYQPSVRIDVTLGKGAKYASADGGGERMGERTRVRIRVYLSMDAEVSSIAEALVEAEKSSQVWLVIITHHLHPPAVRVGNLGFQPCYIVCLLSASYTD